jgi:hypothetical protein
MFSTVALAKQGFTGFVTIEQLQQTRCAVVPKVPGIYIVCHDFDSPEFLEVGTGGHFKNQDPNVPIPVLEQNWVNSADIVYIGKAGGPGLKSSLRGRLQQYMRFGAGSNTAGHRGGCYIWQLRNSGVLTVCWKSEDEPRAAEAAMIAAFAAQHGQRPFANRAN